MGDLFCPARFLLVDPATADIGDLLRAENVAAVFAAAGDGRAAMLAADLAGRLGLTVSEVPAPGHDLRELTDIADGFRGETVVVVTPRADSVSVVEHDEHGWRRVDRPHLT
jgi:hypothetical protein